jgi:DNA-binding beta-propeller fold protein YncE
MLAFVGGCATAPPPAEPARLVWPPPPLTARIESVRSIAGEADLGRELPFFQRLLNFLSGEKPLANRIVEPLGLAVTDGGERLYVSDFGLQAVYVFDFPHKGFSRIDGLSRPVGLALDAEENLYVVEQDKRGISVFNRRGERIRFLTDAGIERPTGIVLDRARGRIYLADTGRATSPEHTVKIFDLQGTLVGRIGREKGEQPGQFMFPTYLALDGAGNLYVTDTLNARVQQFGPDGRHLKTFGSRGDCWGCFDKPKGVALDGFGNVYVADSGWSNVQIFNQQGRTLLFFGGRGPLSGMLKNPSAVVIDKHNRIYVADYLNHRIEVYRLVNTAAADSFLNPTVDSKGGHVREEIVSMQNETPGTGERSKP